MNFLSRSLLYLVLIIWVFDVAVLRAGEITLDDMPVKDLATAMSKAKDGSFIRLSAGDYKQAGVLQANNVTIMGVPNKTRIHGATTWGKGALVIRGQNTRVENIECFGISVPSKNGACIRLDGKNLELNNVYFHDSEQGILTGGDPGSLLINNSVFERLGQGGQAHGIYIGGGQLYIQDSKFLSSKSEGHEIKSRAKKNIIIRTVIASLEGKDSRLIDISNGGVLVVKDSVLQQGNNTSNSNLIGYALEGFSYQENSIELIGNIFLLERKNGNVILHIKDNRLTPQVIDNVFIGRKQSDYQGNFYFPDRKRAGLAEYPFLPETIK